MSLQKLCPQALGFMPPTPSAAMTTLSLNGNNVWTGISFVPDQNKTVNDIRFEISAIVGTLRSGDVHVDVYTDMSGHPSSGLGSLLGSGLSLMSPGSGANISSGFFCPVSGGLMYWAVFKNFNATPASNFPHIQVGSTGVNSFFFGAGNEKYGWLRTLSTSGDMGWISGFVGAGQFGGLRVGYTDGSYDGGILLSLLSTTEGIWGTSELGTQFVVPGPRSVTYNVRGISMPLNTNVGSPTGGPLFGLRINSGSPTYTNSIPGANVTIAGWYTGYILSGTQVLYGGDTVAVTVGDVSGNSDSAVNAYKLPEYAIDVDPNSRPLMPFSGTVLKVLFSGTGSLLNSGAFYSFALLLDTDGEFSGQMCGGGGGQLVTRPTALI